MIYFILFSLFIIEIFILCCGGMIFAHSPSRSIAESLSLGIFLTLILISLIFQTAFLLEIPNLAVIAEVVITLLTIRYLVNNRFLFTKAVYSIWQFILEHKIVTGIVAICWVYLFCLVAIIPPNNWDSMAYNLSRIFLFQAENSLFLENFTNIRQTMFVVGADILNYGFLRLNNDYGVGIFSWLAYISVGLGTYGLARRFADPQVSIATTLTIVSLTEFCFQATSTKNDIFTAASALFCFIVTDRLLAKPNVRDLAILLLGIAFGFSAKTTFLGFLAPFSLCFIILALIKIGWKTLYKMIVHNWLYFIVLTAPIIIISQIWLFLNNAASTGDPTGGETIEIVRNGGIIGGIANLVRYFFQSIHLFPLDYIARGRLGIDLGEYLVSIYDRLFFPIFGNSAMGYVYNDFYSFEVKSLPHEDFAWYGPLGFMIVIPAILWSVIKGNYWLKAQSFCLISFIVIVSFKLYWTPWSNRYVVLFFVASGACVAFFLQEIPKKYRSIILNGITTVALVLLISACILNVTKPLGGLSITEFFKPNIWSRTHLGGDRLYYGRKHYGDNRIEQFRDLVPSGASVALLADKKSWIYHFYLVNPHVEIVPTSLSKLDTIGQTYDYLLCLDVDCNLTQLPIDYQTLWESSVKSNRSGILIQLKK